MTIEFYFALILFDGLNFSTGTLCCRFWRLFGQATDQEGNSQGAVPTRPAQYSV